MLEASLSYWLVDPLGETYTAWRLPIDIGWQVPTGVLNYGLLCLLCSCYTFFLAARAAHVCYRTRKASDNAATPAPVTRQACTMAGLLCLLPLILFVMQYLFIDMGSIAQLARDELQAMLIRSHFNYGSPPQFIPIQSVITFDPLTIHNREVLLIDQIGSGPFLPVLSMLILLAARRLFPSSRHAVSPRRHRWQLTATIAVALLLLVILGRGPAALACNYQAQHLLTTGDYTATLTWLDYAHSLNPALDQLPSYHIEYGQAWYYLHPQQPTTESQAYLADFYSQQNDYLSAYQQLLAARQNDPQSRWLIDETTVTLTRLVEMPHPLNGAPVTRIAIEEPSITWLSALLQADPSNVYAHYLLGRLKYDLHDYASSTTQMFVVLNLSRNTDIQSSAYTYLALSSEGEGNYVTAREYLFRAQDLDPAFRNNTAREEISGLR